MNNSLQIKKEDNLCELSIMEQVVMQGDLSKLTSEQRVLYYKKVCESTGLNPFTRPFEYILLNGKLTLYAKKDATEQLRKIHGISIDKLESKMIDDIYVVTASASTKDGRRDEATGAVTIGHLKADAKANAIMKAETKAKRRVTLSISGIGWADESEIETIPGAKVVEIDITETSGKMQDSAQKMPIPDRSPVANAVISAEQQKELKEIFEKCDKQYVSWVYSFVKKHYNADKLQEFPLDIYDRVKTAAIKNSQENESKKNIVEIESKSLNIV